MPFVKELKAGDHFINNCGDMYEVIAQGRDYAFTRKVSDGEESLYAGSMQPVTLASQSQVEEAGMVSVIMTIIEEADTLRAAAEKSIEHLKAELTVKAESDDDVFSDIRRAMNEPDFIGRDKYLSGVLSVAGAAFAVLEDPRPSSIKRAIRLWPWENRCDIGKDYFKQQVSAMGRRESLIQAAAMIIAEINNMELKDDE